MTAFLSSKQTSLSLAYDSIKIMSCFDRDLYSVSDRPLSLLVAMTCSLPFPLMTPYFLMLLVRLSPIQPPSRLTFILYQIYNISVIGSATSTSFASCRTHHQPPLTGFRNSTVHVRRKPLGYLNNSPDHGSNSSIPRDTSNHQILRSRQGLK